MSHVFLKPPSSILQHFETFNSNLSPSPIFSSLPFSSWPTSPFCLSIIVTALLTSQQLSFFLVKCFRQPIYTVAERIYLPEGWEVQLSVFPFPDFTCGQTSRSSLCNSQSQCFCPTMVYFEFGRWKIRCVKSDIINILYQAKLSFYSWDANGWKFDLILGFILKSSF